MRYFRSGELGLLAAGADAEHFGSTGGARARCRRLAVLHGDSLGVRNLALASTLDAIGFHRNPPCLWVHILYRVDDKLSRCSINPFFTTKCGMQLHQVRSAAGPPSLWVRAPQRWRAATPGIEAALGQVQMRPYSVKMPCTGSHQPTEHFFIQNILERLE